MADDIGSMVEKIIGNPEFRTLIGELRGSGDAPDSAELMSRLPEVMAQLSPLLSSSEPSPDAEAQPSPPADAPVVSGGKFNRKNAERLLTALKPYLRASRCGIIDKCMSVMQISDLIGAAGGLGALAGGAKPEGGNP
ncbi:MAG: hypothetical protein K6A33_02380 [Clostridiales bacterium]|nr:hypothetical protein [Clostridiales bacterium]